MGALRQPQLHRACAVSPVSNKQTKQENIDKKNKCASYKKRNATDEYICEKRLIVLSNMENANQHYRECKLRPCLRNLTGPDNV